MILFIIFLLGICVGSFLNVVIDRIPSGKSIIVGRSHCDYCKKTLAWTDLIPIVSFLISGGACRYCHKRLSFQYPLVELVTGVQFVLLFIFLVPNSLFTFFLYIDALGLCTTTLSLVVMDSKYHILSDKLLIALAFFSTVFVAMNFSLEIPYRVFIGIVSTLPLLAIYLFSKGRGMGFGDVKLVGILGFLVGFPRVIVMYYCAFLTGATVGIILIIARKKKFSGSTIAFGPFLLLGCFIALIWGDTLWHYLLTFLGL